MPDFILTRQAARLADLTATVDVHLDAPNLVDDLDTVLHALRQHVEVAHGTPGEAISFEQALDAIVGAAAVVALAGELGEQTASQLRWVLSRHGRTPTGRILDPTGGQVAAADDGAPAPADEPQAADAAMHQLFAAVEQVFNADPAVAAAGHDALDGLIEFADPDDEFDDFDDVPARRVMVVVMHRTDGRAMTAFEAGAAIGGLEQTLAALGALTVHGAPQLPADGSAVTTVEICSDPDATLRLAAMPGGNVVFDGVLPLVGAMVAVRAVMVDDEDAPRTDDGQLDLDAFLAGLDTTAVVADAGDTDDTVARMRQAYDDAVQAAMEEGALAVAAPQVPRDDAGRPLLAVTFSRQDGGRLDGAALDQVRELAMQTLPRFGTLEQVAVDVQDGQTTLTLAIADERAGQYTAHDVATGIVVWQGSLPFPGIGTVDGRLRLPDAP